jgi:hypothetical protein
MAMKLITAIESQLPRVDSFSDPVNGESVSRSSLRLARKSSVVIS